MEEKIEVEREGGVKVEEEEEAAVLPGFRFHPTDEELVGFYLRRKVERRRLSLEIIKEIDIYKYDPWDLPREGVLGEKEWYFFCLRGRKYRNSIRPNRVTGSGFWKATGIDRSIYSCRNSGECIGLKKSLVYYQGSAGKGTKTDWMMHEYRLPSSPDSIQEAEIWTICRIIKRNVPAKRYRQQIGWKEVAEILDSSSKTSSFGSDCGEEIKNLDCAEEGMGKLCAPPEDWSSGEYVYDSTWRPGSIGASEVLSEGNWDEIGRMVDFMMEPVIADGLVYY